MKVIGAQLQYHQQQLNNKNIKFKGIMTRYEDYLSASGNEGGCYVSIPPNNATVWLYCSPDRPQDKYTVVSLHNREHERNVYIADPLEEIGEDIKSQAGHILYEKPPEYPTIDSQFINTFMESKPNDMSTTEQFDKIRDYNYRAEMTLLKKLDKLKTSKATNMSYDELCNEIKETYKKIDQVKYYQWQAAECINLYRQADAIRAELQPILNQHHHGENERGLNATNIMTYNYYIEKLQATIDACSTVLEEQEKIRSLHNKLDESYQNIIKTLGAYEDKLFESGSSFNLHNAPKEVERFDYPNVNNENLSQLYAAIETIDKVAIYKKPQEDIQEIIQSCQNSIKNLKVLIAEKKVRIANGEALVKEYGPQIEPLKKKMQPYLDNLKTFYIEHGINKVKI